MTQMVGRRVGEYEILEKLGQGGMGASVYRARDLSTQREVALKLLPFQLTGDPDFMARFQVEGQVIARLEHPHILPLYAVGEQDGQPYLVMRYVDGGSLRDRAEAGELTREFLARVIEEVASALDEAHRQGVVHRDIKPGNILLDRRGNAYLADFGLAKMVEGSSHFTASGGIVGTPAYMAPEQWRGEELDARTDVYSLACVVFEVLTGTLPYEADAMAAYMTRHLTARVPSARSRYAGVSRPLDRLLREAMAKPPGKRPESALAFGTELAELLRASGWEAPPRAEVATGEQRTGVSARPPVPGQGRRALLYSGGLALLGVALLVGAFVLSGGFSLRQWLGQLPSNPVSGGGQPIVRPVGVNTVAWSLDGGRLASGGEDGHVLVWDAGSGEILQNLEGHTGAVLGLAWSPNEERIVSASMDHTLRIWDTSAGAPLVTLEGHAAGVRDVAWSPDGGLLASASWDGTVMVWDASGSRLLILDGHEAPVRAVAWSPDGTRLASTAWDRTAIVWDVDFGEALAVFAANDAPLRGVAWSPDGTMLAIASLDRTVILWDVESGDVLQTLVGHSDGVRDVAWSPDGSLLASGAWDNKGIVWDAVSGERVSVLQGHAGGVESVAWSPDGASLASASDDGTVIVWAVQTGQRVRTLERSP